MLAPEMADVVRTLTVDGHLLASSYMHGQNWGNRQAVDDLARTVDHVAGRWDITEVNLIGQSMGGLPSLVAIATDVVPARRWAGIAPVCSLTAAYGTPTFHAGITAAHDIDSPATFHQATAGADPLRDFAPYRFAGTDFRFYVSPDDTFVPASAHAAPMVSFLTRAPADVTTVTVSGVHASDDHYRYGDLARFLAS